MTKPTNNNMREPWLTRNKILCRLVLVLVIVIMTGLISACSSIMDERSQAKNIYSVQSAGINAEVEPDPNFASNMAAAGLRIRNWKTNFSLHTVPFEEIREGGPPRDGIPPLDNPEFVTVEAVDQWPNPLRLLEPVILVELNGDARAYPLQIMTWHEIVNDVVGGVPISVTFCPLCNSAIVFDRRLDGVVYDFGTSGNLRNSDLIMWDRQTESWWQQFTGEAIIGDLAGKKLTFLSSSIIAWKDFRTANPSGKILDQETGFDRPYGNNPYAGYDRVDNPPFLFEGDLDGRLLPMERVMAFESNESTFAFPFKILAEERVVNHSINGLDVVIFFDVEAESAFQDRSSKQYRSVGASGIFEPSVDGQKLTFKFYDERFVDEQTGSSWNILGEAREGPLSGKKMTSLIHADHFWFALGAFRPDIEIYQGRN